MSAFSAARPADQQAAAGLVLSAVELMLEDGDDDDALICIVDWMERHADDAPDYLLARAVDLGDRAAGYRPGA